uniref:PTBP1-like RNA recognition motif 2 domain-containing protein n=1 Tax=Oryza barthii TaxID=65489 RepID=A0A0D3GH16_9ORYZ
MASDADRVLRITVSHLVYPVDEYLLHQLFDGYRAERKIEVRQMGTHVEASVPFQTRAAVEHAWNLNGRAIYDGCCWLDIQWEQQSNNSMTPVTYLSTIITVTPQWKEDIKELRAIMQDLAALLQELAKEKEEEAATGLAMMPTVDMPSIQLIPPAACMVEHEVAVQQKNRDEYD